MLHPALAGIGRPVADRARRQHQRRQASSRPVPASVHPKRRPANSSSTPPRARIRATWRSKSMASLPARSDTCRATMSSDSPRRSVTGSVKRLWGRGIVTEAVILLTGYAFRELNVPSPVRAAVRRQSRLDPGAGEGGLRPRGAAAVEQRQVRADQGPADVRADQPGLAAAARRLRPTRRARRAADPRGWRAGLARSRRSA